MVNVSSQVWKKERKTWNDIIYLGAFYMDCVMLVIIAKVIYGHYNYDDKNSNDNIVIIIIIIIKMTSP